MIVRKRFHRKPTAKHGGKKEEVKSLTSLTARRAVRNTRTFALPWGQTDAVGLVGCPHSASRRSRPVDPGLCYLAFRQNREELLSIADCGLTKPRSAIRRGVLLWTSDGPRYFILPKICGRTLVTSLRFLSRSRSDAVEDSRNCGVWLPGPAMTGSRTLSSTIVSG